MTKRVPCYYWDTSIFVMILQEEKSHGQGTLDGAIDILQKTEKGEAIIIASEIVVAEILAYQYPQNVYDKWEACLQWDNLYLRSVDHPVAVKASKLRSECLKKRPQVKIKTADALHVATFLVYSSQVDELHSLDHNFEQALKHSGETRTATKPIRIQTTMDNEWSAPVEPTEEEPDDLGSGADEVTDSEE